MSSNSKNTVPSHVGFIMDGNRRWAKAQGKNSMQGHEAGVDAFYRAVRACFESGVTYVSAYTFSTENWQRAQEEVKFLMNLVPKVLKRYLREFHEDNIKIVVLGSREGLGKKVLSAIDEAEQTTKDNTKGVVALCFNYGGRQELVDMVREIAKKGIDTAKMTIDDVYTYLYHPEVPPCDLIVRTSGEHRLSGFMLARSEYAEFIFETKMWPDIDGSDVKRYIEEYATRNRRIGK